MLFFPGPVPALIALEDPNVFPVIPLLAAATFSAPRGLGALEPEAAPGTAPLLALLFFPPELVEEAEEVGLE